MLNEIMQILEDASWRIVFDNYLTYEEFESECIDTVINSDLLTDMDTETRNAKLVYYTKLYLEDEHAKENWF